MGPGLGDSPNEISIKELRQALNHLYDPDYLRGSSLAAIVGVSGRFDTSSALQGILTRTIESLKPAPGASNKAHAQEVYELLLYRYVQQFNQEEIANQLGISVRHLRRQQNIAIYDLACRLWEQFQPHASTDAVLNRDVLELKPSRVSYELSGELDWLKSPSSHVATDLSISLEEVHLLIKAFAEQRSVQLVFPTNPTGLLLVHPVAFQQILLSLLSMAIQGDGVTEVDLRVLPSLGWQTLEITAKSSRLSQGSELYEQNQLQMAQKMVELSDGTLDCQAAGGQFNARVNFNSVNRIEVLVIDDNPEIITMMQRFAAETRYRISGLNDPKLAVERALQARPDLIVLDIMMPQIDGLQVLSQFKHHPSLGQIPVIICSVLPLKDLASSLDANDFIQKPIQRDMFITALNQASQTLD
ncbi:MAG: response regulator [Planctomycetes bacterium]|nr:response regulator [Planctomycetota bacterium]